MWNQFTNEDESIGLECKIYEDLKFISLSSNIQNITRSQLSH